MTGPLWVAAGFVALAAVAALIGHRSPPLREVAGHVIVAALILAGGALVFGILTAPRPR